MSSCAGWKLPLPRSSVAEEEQAQNEQSLEVCKLHINNISLMDLAYSVGSAVVLLLDVNLFFEDHGTLTFDLKPEPGPGRAVSHELDDKLFWRPHDFHLVPVPPLVGPHPVGMNVSLHRHALSLQSDVICVPRVPLHPQILYNDLGREVSSWPMAETGSYVCHLNPGDCLL